MHGMSAFMPLSKTIPPNLLGEKWGGYDGYAGWQLVWTC